MRARGGGGRAVEAVAGRRLAQRAEASGASCRAAGLTWPLLQPYGADLVRMRRGADRSRAFRGLDGVREEGERERCFTGALGHASLQRPW